MTIRELNITDYNHIIDVWKKAGLPIKKRGRDSYNRIKDQIESGRITIIGYEEEDELRGVVLLSQDGRKGWINRLAVLPRYQKKGIAKKLLLESEKIFLKQGIEVYGVLIFEDNEASIQCFKNAGYVLWPEVKYFSKRINDES
ncbi:MAG: GNAT family N-acetyltransferase [Candidatus Hodarchaeota archaeon]